MARTFCSGFELNEGTNGLVDADATGTGATFDTAIVRTGTYSGKVALTSGVEGRFTFIGTSWVGFARFYLRVTARPATTARIVFGVTGASQINLRLNANGTIAHFINTTLTGTSTTALTNTNRWYRVEVRQTNGTSVPVLLIDGVTEVTASPSGWLMNNNSLGCSDTVADTYTVYFEDVALDGADFPGEGRVVLLVPISDNARGANWTGGVGGTSNLFEAVNNLPPVGTATETDTTQIEHSGGANNSYDANMTSYANAGVGPYDTVNLVGILAADGEDITTGTKLLAYSVVSNPAIASTGNVSAGDDVGLLGTYPASWAGRRFLGTATSPAVTLETSPVMRVNRPETVARVASVCFMGLYVEFTPSMSPSRPKVHHYPQLLAH